MTDIMKLAAQWGDARIMATRDRATNDEVLQARDAVQSAIEALQAECAEHKENAIRNARIAVSIRAERDQLQAKLDAMGKGEPVGFVAPHDLKTLREGYPATVVMLPSNKRTEPLFAAPKALAPLAIPAARIRTWSKPSEFTGETEGHADIIDWLEGCYSLADGEHTLYALSKNGGA